MPALSDLSQKLAEHETQLYSRKIEEAKVAKIMTMVQAQMQEQASVMETPG